MRKQTRRNEAGRYVARTDRCCLDIKKNRTHDEYGANGYDCTAYGSKVLNEKKYKVIKEISEIIATRSGIFVGNVIASANT
jgi:hypothetical protein